VSGPSGETETTTTTVTTATEAPPADTQTVTTTVTDTAAECCTTTTTTVTESAPSAADSPVDRDTYLQQHYPRSPDDVTTEWLGYLLDKKLTGHHVIKILEAGVTSDAAIFGVEYAAGNSGPASVCLKYAKATESNRVFAMGGDMYKKELFFFQEMYEEVAKVMAIPTLVGVFIDEEKPEEFFCIAMEDLNLGHEAIDQIKGITFDECGQLAKMGERKPSAPLN
jgi:hypothetical protein